MNHTTKRRTPGESSETPVRGLPISSGSWPINNRRAASIKAILGIEPLANNKILSTSLLPPDGLGVSGEMQKRRKYLEGAP